MKDLVKETYSTSSTGQHALGEMDGLGISDIPLSGMETVYSGSQGCPGCGVLMNPLQVIYGNGLCPRCQALKNAAVVKGRMSNG